MGKDLMAWEWLEQNQLSYDIWDKKYRYNNESLDEWFDRVSGGDQELRQLIKDKKFLFGGRILANRGLQDNGRKIVYSNCYVLTPPDDNLDSIFNTARDMAKTFSRGGGVGINVSKLSPRGAKINNAAIETSGAVSFMDLYSLTTELIGQHGRRGALMISLNCTHPDIEEFIDLKYNLDKVTKANISVMVTDDFMNAVLKNDDIILDFIREETGENIKRLANARNIFKKLAKANHEMAEPGILFWDTISNYHLMSEVDGYEFAGVNP